MYNKNITGGILEEKLYFSPANYGKGLKKHREKSASAGKQTDGEKEYKALKLGSFLLFLVILTVVLIWLLRGKITTIGQYPANIRNETLECVSHDLKYKKVSSAYSDNSELKIIIISHGDKGLSSASLLYTLVYPTELDAYSAEARAHAEFNNGLVAAGFSSEKFSNKFTLLDNKLVISIYATSEEINEYTHDYFLIDDTDVKTLDDYKAIYDEQGFKCISALNEKNN